jgi:hypothetical protein
MKTDEQILQALEIAPLKFAIIKECEDLASFKCKIEISDMIGADHGKIYGTLNPPSIPKQFVLNVGKIDDEYSFDIFELDRRFELGIPHSHFYTHIIGLKSLALLMLEIRTSIQRMARKGSKK